MFHDYLIEHNYFNVLPTLMKRLKNDLEKHLNLEILLFEMDDWFYILSTRNFILLLVLLYLDKKKNQIVYQNIKNINPKW